MKKLFSVSGIRFAVFGLFFFLATLYSLLATSFSCGDEIKIRTVVTPIGQQAEKLGTTGLMVCVTNKTVANGGCGTGGTITAKDAADPANKTVVIDNTQSGTVVIFLDDGDHQFDKDDIVYEVRR